MNISFKIETIGYIVAEYLFLRANKKQLNIPTINRFEDDSSWKQKHDLSFELELLK